MTLTKPSVHEPSSVGYPVLRAGLELHRNAEGGFVLLSRPRRETDGWGRNGATDAFTENYRIEGYIIDYLRHVDGCRDRAALHAKFSEEYNSVFSSMLADRAWNWLTSQRELVEFCAEPTDVDRSPRVKGNAAAFFPMHSIFEIIETCNFACDHCYYSSAPWKKGRIGLDDARKVMDTLADHGVKIIELTGGECTIHPDFLEILDYASRTFELVAIITNGYRIGSNEGFAQRVCAIPNLVAQVSIDAMGERHDKFRKHARAFDAAVEAIQRLLAAGHPVRMASSITEHTVQDIPALHQLGKELGVTNHNYAPVAPLGRGCNVTEAGAASTELLEKMNRALSEVLTPEDSASIYAEMPDAAEVYEPARNCGAGWRTFTIDYDGNVRACNFSRDSKRFGNILTDDYQDIFGQQASFYFHNAPSPGGRDCQGCDYLFHCRGCFVKAFMVSETVYPECPWRHHWFPNMPLSAETGSPDGHASLAEKHAKVPRFTLEDSPQMCTSCAADVPDPASPAPATSSGSRTVFLGGIGHRPPAEGSQP